MNKRIAKKILLCRSNLCADKDRVLSARKVHRDNPEWFRNRGIFLTYPYKGEQRVITSENLAKLSKATNITYDFDTYYKGQVP